MPTGIGAPTWDSIVEMPYSILHDVPGLITEPDQRVIQSRALDTRPRRVLALEQNYSTVPDVYLLDDLWDQTNGGILPILVYLPHENQFALTEAIYAGFSNNDPWLGWQRIPATPTAFTQYESDLAAVNVPPIGRADRIRGNAAATQSSAIVQEPGQWRNGHAFTQSWYFLEDLSEHVALVFSDGTTEKTAKFSWAGGVLTAGATSSGITSNAPVAAGGGWYRADATIAANTFPVAPMRCGVSTAFYEDGVYGPQRLTNSDDLSSVQWTKTATITADDADGPFPYQTGLADKVDDASAGAAQDVFQDIAHANLVDTKDYTASWYLKNATGSDKAIVEISHGGAAPYTRAQIDFTAKTVSIVDAGGSGAGTHTAHIEDLDVTLPGYGGTGWFQVGATATYDATGSPGMRARLIPTDNVAATLGSVHAIGALFHEESDTGVKTPNRYAYRGSVVWGGQLVFGSLPLAYRSVARQRQSPMLLHLRDMLGTQQRNATQFRLPVRMQEVVI